MQMDARRWAESAPQRRAGRKKPNNVCGKVAVSVHVSKIRRFDVPRVTFRADAQ